jgi:signal transduction histidine kinase
VIWQRRRDLERRLNDEAAGRLATLSLELGLLAMDLCDPAAVNRLTRLQDDVRVILEDLRDIGSELYPPVLVSAGVGPALRAFAERRGMALSVRAAALRYPTSVETALYFGIVEILDPVDSAEASEGSGEACTVTVHQAGDDLVATVTGGRNSLVRVPHPIGS